MKVVAFNGSPRQNGNTCAALRTVLSRLEKEGIDTELVQVGGKRLWGCINCGKCRQNRDMRCAVTSDEMNGFLVKMYQADGILIGSPVYFGNITPETKALIDRGGYVSQANGGLLRRKVGAAVVCARRAGATFAYSAINFFFGISEMVIPSSSYWNLSLSRAPGDFARDAEGVATFEKLGENMAFVLKKLNRRDD